IGQSVQHPLHTVTTKDRFGLVTIKGQDYKIVDIGMRMLEPHELFAAQGFPSDYIIDVDADGRKYSKSAQVARCGNAVPPPFAESLVRANLPELCTGSGRTLTLSKYHAENQLGQLAFNL
ncbi:DNA cytosine methyltransferase, partial [Paenibacillus larvae]